MASDAEPGLCLGGRRPGEGRGAGDRWPLQRRLAWHHGGPRDARGARIFGPKKSAQNGQQVPWVIISYKVDQFVRYIFFCAFPVRIDFGDFDHFSSCHHEI